MLVGEWSFACNFILTKATADIFYYISRSGSFLENRITNVGRLLHYLPYDESLLPRTFNLNTADEVKGYLKDHIGLFEKFIAAYLQQQSTNR